MATEPLLVRYGSDSFEPLRVGDRGVEVGDLQRLLKAAGFDPGAIDGIFGPATERAVRAFQAARGLSVDGIVGRETTGALYGPQPASGDTTLTGGTSGGSGDTSTSGSTGGGGGGGSTGGGGGGGGGSSLPAAGTARQIPGGGELWRVGGSYWLAYKVPGTNTPLVWKIEDRDRLQAIFGTTSPNVDRTMTWAQFKKRSPWRGGLSAELQVTDDNPWQVFKSKFDEQAELRPWLKDPTVQAVIGIAYLEGREPTTDELSRTDWWNNHTEAERAWMESSVTAGTAEIERRIEDAKRQTRDTLAELGMGNPPTRPVSFIAEQLLTGKWSQDYAEEQMRRLADPWAAGDIDKGLLHVIQSTSRGASGDARALSAGPDAIRDRVLQLFENRSIPGQIGKNRLARIVREIEAGERTFDQVRAAADREAARTPGGRPGAFDVNREGEDEVRQMARRWLGPVAGKFQDREVAEWAGRIRNDPDAATAFKQHLQQQRKSILPGYSDESLTYEDIVTPVRNMATNIWGQPIDDETMLVDLANTMDYTEMAKRLRRQGLQQGIAKVTRDALGGLMSTGLGEQVQRSTI